MLCPACAGKPLTEVLGSSGVVEDLCAACGGRWLEKGQVYHYVNDPQRLYEDFMKAFESTVLSQRPCPRCQEKLREVRLEEASLVLEMCSRCGGMWFEQGELPALQKMLDRELAAWRESAGSPTRPALAAPAALAALPSLALRSAGVLLGLYAVLLGFFAIAIAYFRLPLDFVFAAAGVALVLDFLLAPFLTDLSLRWCHDFRWVNPDDLAPELRRFVNDHCQKQGIPFPRCGLLKDGNPNAFTYGHYPGNARLVLTSGVMQMLEKKELEAVVGHEMGHIVHWDMLVMTAAALVPLIFYTIYKAFMRAERRSSGREKGSGAPLILGLTALCLYYVTEYVVLFLSRTRELHADRFSGEITRDPNSLASALVKVAYGLAGRPKESPEESGMHETVRALGIFDPVSAMGLVAATMSKSGAPSKENIQGAMQWDLWNPWAKYYELQSTHPLPAHRLELLGKQAAAYGQAPYIRFDMTRFESYWDAFLGDVAVLWVPFVLAAAGAAVGVVGASGTWRAGEPRFFWAIAAGWGAGQLCKLLFSYPTDFNPEMTVSALLKKIKVSGVRGIPVSVKGKIIGRGIPGYILSEDLVLQDSTGFILLDYRQPLALSQWIFAIKDAPNLIGEDVEVHGWYRRAPVPYIEMRELSCGGRTRTCYSREGQYVFAFLSVALGLAGLFGLL